MEISFVKHGILLYSYALQGARNHCSGNITHFNEVNISDNLGCTSCFTFFALNSFWCHLWFITEQMHVNIESICWFAIQFPIFLHHSPTHTFLYALEILKSSFRHSIPLKKNLGLFSNLFEVMEVGRKSDDNEIVV